VINWAGFVKSSIDNLPTVPLIYQAKASEYDKAFARMSLKEQVASLFIFHKSGYNKIDLKKYVDTYKPGGLILMGDNIPSGQTDLKDMISYIQSESEYPLLIAIDQEGGVVKRIESDNFLAPTDLQYYQPSVTKDNFKNRSKILKDLGINLNFGIVADATYNQNSFIYLRTFGGNYTEVSKRVAEAAIGSKGLTLTTLKHFPGHGETSYDSHNLIPETDISHDLWKSTDALPFVAGINSGADFVMFGHLIYSQVDSLPASLSQKWHQKLNELGFDGLTITDDMIMLQQSGDDRYQDPIKNTIRAINAGNTMILFVLDNGGVSSIEPDTIINGVLKAIDSGKIDKKIIEKNARQVFRLRYDLTDILKD